MRSAYFPINSRLHRETKRERERERKRERLCPTVQWWKHRNGTTLVIWDLHISLFIGDCKERQREAKSICEMMKTQKWYYICNTRSAYLCINRRLHGERERETKREREREREALSIHETVKTQKWYYLCNTRSAYLCINRRLHRERETKRERERETKRERERGYVHLWNRKNTEIVLSP